MNEMSPQILFLSCLLKTLILFSPHWYLRMIHISLSVPEWSFSLRKAQQEMKWVSYMMWFDLKVFVWKMFLLNMMTTYVLFLLWSFVLLIHVHVYVISTQDYFVYTQSISCEQDNSINFLFMRDQTMLKQDLYLVLMSYVCFSVLLSVSWLTDSFFWLQ